MPNLIDPLEPQTETLDIAPEPVPETVELPRVCSDCGRESLRVYYRLGELTLCEECRLRMIAGADQRPRVKRFFTAAGAGLAAAIVGSLIYFGVAKYTGYRFGLVAAVIGFMVGGAVRWGTHARGGRIYQALAIILTYSSMSVTYLPALLQAVNKPAQTSAAVSVAKPGAKGAQPQPQAKAVAKTPLSPLFERINRSPKPIRLIFRMVVLYLLSLPLPIIASSPVGWLITAFGVYEAWKLNKPKAFVIEGPIVSRAV